MNTTSPDRAGTAPAPDSVRIMAAVDTTWPAAETVVKDGWTLRRGAGGGKRVSAASGSGDIAVAESAMRAWGQVPMFRLTPEDSALDAALAAAGYDIVDPVALYAAPTSSLTGEASHMAAVYTCAFRPAIVEEIWAAGDIGAGRLAVMDRAGGPSTTLLSRADDLPCAVAFAAIDGDVAMIHAIEVLSPFRRKGAGRLLIEGAARFAETQGAAWLTLAVTEANAPARALYEAMGMTVAGTYHYRIKPESAP